MLNWAAVSHWSCKKWLPSSEPGSLSGFLSAKNRQKIFFFLAAVTEFLQTVGNCFYSVLVSVNCNCLVSVCRILNFSLQTTYVVI